MVTKVAGGIIGIGLVGTGSIAMAKPHWLGMDYMPEHKPLSGEEGFSSSYASPKFGNKYGKYLASVKKENKSWWDWAYRRLSREEIEAGKFTNKGDSNAIKVSKPYAEGTEQNHEKALNQVCKAAYETNDSNGFETGSGTEKFKKSDVWKYCSPRVTFVSTVDYGDNTIGKDSENASKLISVKDSLNDWFWKIRNEDFWADSGDWSGSKAKDENNKSVFKEAFGKKSQTSNNTSERKTIKQLCGEAYKQLTTSQSGNNNKDDALKFCVLEASNP